MNSTEGGDMMGIIDLFGRSLLRLSAADHISWEEYFVTESQFLKFCTTLNDLYTTLKREIVSVWQRMRDWM